MATPSVVKTPGTHNWVGSASTYNLLKPQIDNTLYQRYGDQDITGLIEKLGGKNPVAGATFKHFEEERLHEVIVATGTAGAAGAAVTYTFQSASKYTFPTSAVSPYITVGASATGVTETPLRVGDVIQFSNGVQAVVYSISGSTSFVAYPKISSESCPTTTANDEIIIVGTQWGEGTDQPDSLNRRVLEYNNDMQIFKESYKATGTSMGEQIWVEVPGLGGKKGYVWYYKGQNDAFKYAKNLREISMVVGKKTTNTTFANLTNDTATTVSTEGLIPFIENYGNTTTYSAITGITRQDFENMILNQLDKNSGSRENALFAGLKLRQGIDRFIGAEMKEGGVVFAAFGGNKEQYVNFGFDSFQLSGYTFHLKTYDVFNNPKMLGATGFKYPGTGLVIPMARRKELVGVEKQGVELPAIRLNYMSNEKAGGNYSREWEEWLTGGANGVFTNQNDSVTINYRSHCGLEAFGANRFVKIVEA